MRIDLFFIASNLWCRSVTYAVHFLDFYIFYNNSSSKENTAQSSVRDFQNSIHIFWNERNVFYGHDQPDHVTFVGK